ncbi:hypothetical protein KAH27_01150 [bacterium]|nr:hypothetical protein [bacterium]
MKKFKFDDIMEAFFFVNAGGLANNTAVLDNSTGIIYWQSEDSEINEIPKGFLDSKEILEEWYKFEDESQKKALREWCTDNEIELID